QHDSRVRRGAMAMKQRRRIYYSPAQRAEIWDRWRRGESMHDIGRLFDRGHSSVFSVLAPTGGHSTAAAATITAGLVRNRTTPGSWVRERGGCNVQHVALVCRGGQTPSLSQFPVRAKK